MAEYYPHFSPMKLLEQIIVVADVFADARGIGRKRVSTLVFNRGSKIDDIVSGGADINTRNFERAMEWFSENWPSGAEWPPAVERPVVKVSGDTLCL